MSEGTEAVATVPVPVEATSTKAEAVVGEIVGNQSAYTTEARVELTAEDRLLVSKLENEFLRAQAEIIRLQGVAKSAQERFPQVLDQLVRKYFISPVTHVFDNVELVFKRK